MRFNKRNSTNRNTKKNSSSLFLPVLPLVRIKIQSEDLDKAKYIGFTLKATAGTAATSSHSYKKIMKTFDEGSPQEWMDLLMGLEEIWRQNSIDAALDKKSTVCSLLKGESKTAFETALEDATEENEELDNSHIEIALRAVTDIVFPFRALETQKNWMNRYMRKPYDMTAAKLSSALSRLNNYLPLFPNGKPTSKFSDTELIELMEFSLPASWRKEFDRQGFVPSEWDKKELVDRCERLERNETPSQRDYEEQRDDNKKTTRFEKSTKNNKKMGT